MLLDNAEGEKNGYAISKEVEGVTGGAVVLNPAPGGQLDCRGPAGSPKFAPPRVFTHTT